MVGIEGDNPDDTDAHWRMGYNYPVQLTQWALAAATLHPIATLFLKTLLAKLREAASDYPDMRAASLAGAFDHFDPLKLTGPEAVTVATRDWLAEQSGLRWNSLTGLNDGGRSKLVLDTLVLPITAFRLARPIFPSKFS
jgi:hypothetical protein